MFVIPAEDYEDLRSYILERNIAYRKGNDEGAKEADKKVKEVCERIAEEAKIPEKSDDIYNAYVYGTKHYPSYDELSDLIKELKIKPIRKLSSEEKEKMDKALEDRFYSIQKYYMAKSDFSCYIPIIVEQNGKSIDPSEEVIEKINNFLDKNIPSPKTRIYLTGSSVESVYGDYVLSSNPRMASVIIENYYLTTNDEDSLFLFLSVRMNHLIRTDGKNPGKIAFFIFKTYFRKALPVLMRKYEIAGTDIYISFDPEASKLVGAPSVGVFREKKIIPSSPDVKELIRSLKAAESLEKPTPLYIHKIDLPLEAIPASRFNFAPLYDRVKILEKIHSILIPPKFFSKSKNHQEIENSYKLFNEKFDKLLEVKKDIVPDDPDKTKEYESIVKRMVDELDSLIEKEDEAASRLSSENKERNAASREKEMLLSSPGPYYGWWSKFKPIASYLKHDSKDYVEYLRWGSHGMFSADETNKMKSVLIACLDSLSAYMGNLGDSDIDSSLIRSSTRRNLSINALPQKARDALDTIEALFEKFKQIWEKLRNIFAKKLDKSQSDDVWEYNFALSMIINRISSAFDCLKDSLSADLPHEICVEKARSEVNKKLENAIMEVNNEQYDPKGDSGLTYDFGSFKKNIFSEFVNAKTNENVISFNNLKDKMKELSEKLKIQIGEDKKDEGKVSDLNNPIEMKANMYLLSQCYLSMKKMRGILYKPVSDDSEMLFSKDYYEHPAPLFLGTKVNMGK